MSRRTLSHIVTLSLTLFALLIILSPISAAPILRPPNDAMVGDGTPESCTDAALQDAIVTGGYITFNCGAQPHTIIMTPANVNQVTTVDGGDLITLSGGSQNRLFTVTHDGTLTVQHVILIDGSTDENGGAILNQGILVVADSDLRNHRALGGAGGAIYNESSATLTLSNSYFNGNQAADGGVVAGNGTMTSIGSTFELNAAVSGRGGVLYVEQNGALTMDNNTMQYNSAVSAGGALFVEDGASASLNYIDIFSNSASAADAEGGGISNSGIFDGNLLWLKENVAAYGGGFYNNGVIDRIDHSAFTNNTGDVGGGIFNRGAGVWENVTVSANVATSRGGGLYQEGSDPLWRFSTWANNTAPDGGTLLLDGGTLQHYANIFADDTCVNNGGSLASIGYSLQNGTTCNLLDPTDYPNTNPILAGLATNGGRQTNHMPLQGSPAIDRVPPDGCPTDDQRLYPRPLGEACDIGAVEAEGAVPTPTPTPTLTPTPPPTPPDFTVVGMEVTQGIQNLNNDVRLVANKRTLVRVFVRTNILGPSYYPHANLYVTSAAGNELVYPRRLPEVRYFLLSNNTIRRESRSVNVYEFYVSTNLLRSNTRMEFEVNPIYFTPPFYIPRRDVTETNYNNNTLAQTFNFETVPSMDLRLFDLGYTFNNARVYPSALDHKRVKDWLRNAYPISRLNYVQDRMELFSTPPTTNDALAWLTFSWRLFLWGGDIDESVKFYGLSADTGYAGMDPDIMRGLAPTGNADPEVAVGPSGTRTWGWDDDGSYADWYTAHELGHTFSRLHPQERSDPMPNDDVTIECGHSSDDPTAHYTNALISPVYTGRAAYWGWDWHADDLYISGTRNGQMLDPSLWADMMSYCDNQWIADYTYEAIMSQLMVGERPTPLSAEAQLVTDRLLVVGSIDPATNEATLLPLQILPDATDFRDRVDGGYAIVLRDSGGTELVRYPFTPSGNLQNDSGPVEQGEDPTPSEGSTLLINEFVPWVEGTARVEIENGGAVIGSVSSGTSAPTVTVTSPTSGNLVSGSPDAEDLSVSWTASDPDGDNLTYSVLYSDDNGTTWHTVALNVTGTETTIPSEALSVSTQARIRVLASDGIRTGYDDSEPFTVENHLPTLTLVEPTIGTTLVQTQTLMLSAEVYDSDEGTLPDEAITWSSNRDGVIAQGAETSATGLSFGTHLITVTVDDGDGGVVSQSLTVEVVGEFENLPQLPSGWLIDPPSLLFDTTQGITEIPLLVRNQAGPQATFAWSATTDVPWLSLSTTSGTTPTDLTVTLLPDGLAVGTYSGTITFTCPDLADSYTVTVQAVVGEGGAGQRLFLPVIQR